MHFSLDAANARAHDPVARLAEDCIAQSRTGCVPPLQGVGRRLASPRTTHFIMSEARAALSLESNEVSKAAQDPSTPPLWQRVLSLRQNPFFFFCAILHPSCRRMEMQPHTFTAR
jgi:hypothetical protein